MLATIAVGPWLGSPIAGPARVVAIALVAAGLALVLWSRAALGRSFTPFPKPVEGGALVSSGPYRFVRHPIYSAVLMTLAGWTILWQSLPGAAMVAILAVVLDLKARREETWLAESYPAYGDYKQRTRKLIPFIY